MLLFVTVSTLVKATVVDTFNATDKAEASVYATATNPTNSAADDFN